MHHVYSGKLHRVDARKLLVRCGSATRRINELDMMDMELEREAIRKAQAEANRALGAMQKPFKSFPEVTAFIDQFKVALHRYKFLVICGPPRLGKTTFAHTLCDTGYGTLEINCAGGTEPDMRAYRLSEHGLVLFDEIQAHQVAAQRLLFQSSDYDVRLGRKAANNHHYSISLWRKKLVLTCNNWHESVASLPPEAKTWINSNSIVLDVKARMWLD